MTKQRCPDAGLTLVEVLVALVLFALIGTAGFGMLDQVLRVQERTEGRLERLAALQRTLYLVTADFAAAMPGTVTLSGTGGAPAVDLRRSAPDATAGAVSLHYAADSGGVVRTVTAADGTVRARQLLLDGVDAASWRMVDPQTGWITDWPPPGSPPMRAPRNPSAVELRLSLADGTAIRRVALLPAPPQ